MPAMSSPGTWLAVVCLALASVTAPRAARLQDNLFSVTTLDGQRAWVVGNFGAVFVTKDGGKSWTPQDAGTRTPLFSVDFSDATHGWIVGQGGLILRTTDGGGTWTPQPSPVPGGKHFFGVEAVDRDTAWAVGDWGAIATTTNGGATWKDVSLGVLTIARDTTGAANTQILTGDVILYDVEFIDPQHGAVAGEFGTIFFTADGGASWRRAHTGTDKTLFGVTMATPTEAWAVGIDGIILHTVDAGLSWQVQHGVIARSDIGELSFTEAIDNPGLYEVAVRGGFGVVVGDTGALFVSSDGGQSWQRRELAGDDRLVWMRGAGLASGGGFLVGAAGFTATVVDREIVTSAGVAGEPQPD